MAAAAALRALITGATGGIGRATSFALIDLALARGLRASLAVAASRPGPALDELVADLGRRGADAFGLHGNLASGADFRRIAGAALSEQARSHERWSTPA